jgi:hypothetical protein
MENLRELSTLELRKRLLELAKDERHHLVRLLEHLAEWDRREGPQLVSFPTLFKYCIEELRYSEDAAQKRIMAARAAARFPKILEMMREGSLTLTAASILSSHVNNENADELLSKASGRSTYEVRRLVARGGGAETPDKIKPLGDDRVYFEFVGGEDLRSLISRAKELLWHKSPAGRLEFVFTEVLKDYISRHDRDLLIEKGGGAGKISSGRYVPYWVQRFVWKRDQGRCVFTREERVCGERSGLEFDHIKPVAMGGRSEPDNIRLLCRAHNQLRAREVFGDAASRHMRH